MPAVTDFKLVVTAVKLAVTADPEDKRIYVKK